jgi:hypothetical protein
MYMEIQDRQMAMANRRRRTLWVTLRSALLACAVLSALLASSARAAEEPSILAFNPQLSLTGDCSTSELDPVEDPGCPGGEHPPSAFIYPAGIAVDAYGNVYVGNAGPTQDENGSVDVFDPEGNFISELALSSSPRALAVDSKGYLYVSGYETEHPFSSGNFGPDYGIVRFDPSVYDPAAGEIAYSSGPTRLSKSVGAIYALAVNPENDHLFINMGHELREYSSAEEGNVLLDPEVAPINSGGTLDGVMAVDAVRGRIYVSSLAYAQGPQAIRVYELDPPHDLIRIIDGSTSPDGQFLDDRMTAGVDERSGHLFVYEPEIAHSLLEFGSEGEYLTTIKHGFAGPYHGVAVDDGPHSPNGALNPAGPAVWVTSATSSTTGHAFAFNPPSECPPTVESVSVANVGETEALLRGKIQPCQLTTSYRFEYVSEAQFEATGFEGAASAGEGTLPAGASPVKVSAPASGLTPGTRYRFRLVATNSHGSDEAESSFKTYPAAPAVSCPNDALRTGLSALLPDCRAYELVTPPNTGGLTPEAMTNSSSQMFLSQTASPGGDKVFFKIAGGGIPGQQRDWIHGGGPIPRKPGTGRVETEQHRRLPHRSDCGLRVREVAGPGIQRMDGGNRWPSPRPILEHRVSALPRWPFRVRRARNARP